MKIKVEVEVPIDVQGDKIVIKSLDALTRVLGTSAAASSAHLLGVKKLDHQTWTMSIADFKKRIGTLEEKKQDLNDKLSFMYQILNTIQPTDDFDGFEDFGFEEKSDDIGDLKKINQEPETTKRKQGERVTNKIVPWTQHEHVLIQENLDKLDIMSIRELAELLAPHLTKRNKNAIEQRIAKQKKGKAKKPKSKIMTQVPEIFTEKPTFSGEKKPMQRRNAWSYEEYMLVKNNLDKLPEYKTVTRFSKALMPFLPGRSYQAVHTQVRNMLKGTAKQPSPSLSSKPLMPPKKIGNAEKSGESVFYTIKPSGKNKRWSPEEVKILLANFHKTNKEIKKLLPFKRGTHAIETKKYDMRKKGLAPQPTTPHHYMTRNKPLPPVTKEDSIKMLGGLTTRQTGLPPFSMIPHQSERYLEGLIKDCLMRKSKIQYADVRWIQSTSRWNGALWNEFITEFIMNAPKIANHFGIDNKFVIEKHGGEKLIVYKRGQQHV